jgi:hypothetical protein
VATPVAAGPEQVIDEVSEHLSYLDRTALRTLAATVESIEAEGIPGLIVETGTARGGSAITMASAKSPDRPMKVFDVFGMIPPPGERDGADVHKRYATIAAGASKGIGGETYYGYRDDLLAEVPIVRAPLAAARRQPRRAHPGPFRSRSTRTSPSRSRTSTATGTRPR